MRRRAISQRVQKKSEALPPLLFVQSQKREHARLQFLAVNADAPRSKLRSIQHQIVTLRAHFLRCGFELMNVFFSDSRERMLRRHPALFAEAPFEERKTREPQKFPAILRYQIQPFRERQSQLPRDQGRRVGSGNLLRGRDGHDQVPGLRVRRRNDVLDCPRAQRLFERRTRAFRRHFNRV